MHREYPSASVLGVKAMVVNVLPAESAVILWFFSPTMVAKSSSFNLIKISQIN
jgi:hypothetical protein